MGAQLYPTRYVPYRGLYCQVEAWHVHQEREKMKLLQGCGSCAGQLTQMERSLAADEDCGGNDAACGGSRRSERADGEVLETHIRFHLVTGSKADCPETG